MLTAQLLLDDASGDEVTWDLIRYESNGSTRINAASSLVEKDLLYIRHSTSGQGLSQVQRDNVAFEINRNDVSGVLRKGGVSLTVTRPVAGGITDQMIKDALANLIDLVSDGGFSGSGMAGVTNISAILQGQS